MQQRQDFAKNFSLPSYIQCLSGNIALSLCCTENCKQSAFICDSSECECKKNNHRDCDIIITTEKFMNMLKQQKKEITPYLRSIFDEVIKNCDQLIDFISQERIKLIDYEQTFGLGSKTAMLVNSMSQGNFQQIKGSLGYKCWKQLQREQIYYPTNFNWSQQANFYEKQIKSLFNIIAYEITDPDIQIQKSIAKCQKDVTAQLLVIHCDYNWQFIFAQIKAFTNLSQLDIAYHRIGRIKNLENITSLNRLVLSIYTFIYVTIKF